jgi:membrane associated rhomboid family serine protease
MNIIGSTSIITTVIIAITVLISILAFNDHNLKQKLIFSPYQIKRSGEWYRFFTSGLIHADWMHLIFNMYVLYGFGQLTETYYVLSFGSTGPYAYALMYVVAIALAEVYSYFKNQDNPYYASLGASGAVSAVLFSSILFNPWSKIGIIFIPIGIPGVVMGALYLVYCQYKARKADDNIGHNAHFYGALFGFVFPLFLKPHLIIDFVNIIKWNLTN